MGDSGFPSIIMVPIVEIIRVEEHDSFGTFGVLRLNKNVFCVTLEPPDRTNFQNISSIPAQQYICYQYKSSKYGKTFEVRNVPGREHVLFHAGNVAEHTKGCIILAEHFGKLQGRRAVLNSGATFKSFMEVMKGVKFFHLTVYEKY